MKEKSLREARATSKAHVKAFRSGAQDARKGGDQSDPKSPSALQLKTRRRGSVSGMRSPSPSGGA
jgi:hypothetical protein